jgi:hypothetical protein
LSGKKPITIKSKNNIKELKIVFQKSGCLAGAFFLKMYKIPDGFLSRELYFGLDSDLISGTELNGSFGRIEKNGFF